MSVFRLVLFLTGLTIYLVVKQYLHSEQSRSIRGKTIQGQLPAPGAQRPLPKDSLPKTPRPQTKPHIEILKSETSYV